MNPNGESKPESRESSDDQPARCAGRTPQRGVPTKISAVGNRCSTESYR
jgi:hypothetical protein